MCLSFTERGRAFWAEIFFWSNLFLLWFFMDYLFFTWLWFLDFLIPYDVVILLMCLFFSVAFLVRGLPPVDLLFSLLFHNFQIFFLSCCLQFVLYFVYRYRRFAFVDISACHGASWHLSWHLRFSYLSCLCVLLHILATYHYALRYFKVYI